MLLKLLPLYFQFLHQNYLLILSSQINNNVPGIHKRMVQFQKLLQNVFHTLHGHSIHCQQWELSKFLMRCQQFASHAYFGAAGPVSKMASQQKAFCVLPFEVSRSVITMQHEFHAWIKNTHHTRIMSSFKPCTKLTDLDTSRGGTQKAFSCCDTILETGPAALQ
jgi:hypothetical protein